MKLLALLNACKPIGVGIASLSVLSGGALATINTLTAETPEPEIVVVEETETSVLEAQEETLVMSSESTTQYQSTTSAQVTGTQPKQDGNGATGHTAALGYSTPEPTKEPVKYVNPENGAVNRKYLTQNDFELAYLGVCPQNVVEGDYPYPLAAGVALGYLTNSVNIYDSMSLTDYMFSVMKSGLNYYRPNDGFGYAHNLGVNTTGEDGVDRWALAVTIDWPSRKIGWKRVDNGDKALVGTRLYNDMEVLTSRMTSRLHQRESEFKAKCGY